MNGTCKRTTMLLCFLLILCVPFAFALQEGFEAYPSSKTLSVCSCGVGEDALVLQNTGELPSNYEMQVSGEASSWVTYTQKKVTLQPGEMKRIPYYVNVPCNGNTAFSFTTSIKTSLGLEKTVQQEITLQDCLSFSIAPLNDFEQSSCPCHPLQYDFDVVNSAEGAEVFDLRVEPKEYATLSETQIVLGKNEHKTVSVFVNLPCDQAGTFAYNLFAVAQYHKIEGKHPFIVDSLPCYGYTVTHQDQYETCKQLVNTFPITVQNTQDIANVLTASLNGVSWAALNQSTVFLGPKENATIIAILDPQETAAGNYTAHITFTPNRGMQEYKKDINLKLNDCFDANLIPASEIPQIVGCEQSAYGILVDNVGTKQAKLSFGLTAPPFVTLDKTQMTLAKGQQGLIQEKINAPCTINEAFTTDLTAQFTDIPYIGKGLRQEFAVVPFNDAYTININIPKISVGYEPEQKTIVVENLGIRDATLALSLQAPSFVSINPTRITVPVNSSVAVELTTQPQDTDEQATYPLVLTAQLVNPYNQQLSFVQEFNVTLGVFNWLWVIIPLIVLLVLGALGYFMLQKKGTKAAKEKKAKAPIKAKKTSRLKQKLGDLGGHFTLRFTPKFWKILAVIALILLVGLATYFLSPVHKQAQEVQAEEGVPATPIVTAQTIRFGEGVSAAGNVVSINKKSTIPIVITNNEGALTYDVKTQLQDWVTADTNSVMIPPGEQRTITLTVDPTGVAPGDYPLTFEIGIKGTAETREETVILRIRKVSAWQYIVFFALLGIIIAGIIIALLRKRTPKIPAVMQKPSRAEQFSALGAKMQSRFFTKERLKKMLWIIVPILIIALLFGLYFLTPLFKSSAQQQTIGEQFQEKAQGKEQAPETEITVGEENARAIAVDDRGLVLPLRIRNANPELTYRIGVQKSVDWIVPNTDLIEIPPSSVGNVSLAIDPDSTVAEGTYNIEIGVTIEGNQQLFKQNLLLKYQKRWWKHLLEWIIALLIGIGIVVGVVYWWKRKKKTEPAAGVMLR